MFPPCSIAIRRVPLRVDFCVKQLGATALEGTWGLAGAQNVRAGGFRSIAGASSLSVDRLI